MLGLSRPPEAEIKVRRTTDNKSHHVVMYWNQGQDICPYTSLFDISEADLRDPQQISTTISSSYDIANAPVRI
ncbi:hypothetical protein RRG08_026709 [Elysia crispata]|uniref:Uncharacterized protein n=1 Tax=Elysia crispata TaxID=231223 RepID=A0AAE1CN22_9GAST|nr:hypothetical protein RRG08_026709 [Elysia crispata]